MKSTFAACAIAAGLLLCTAALAAQDNGTTTQTQTTTTTTNDNSTSQSNSTLPDKDSASTPSPNMATTPDTSATATQDTTNTDRSSNVRTVTGCLQKSDTANEYQLTGKDGSTWELKSDAVDLSSHVGHTVTITGAVRNAGMHGMKEDAKREASDHGVGNSAEHGHMTVTKLTMVSTDCAQ